MYTRVLPINFTLSCTTSRSVTITQAKPSSPVHQMRPILEYASTVWDQHYKSDADKLERTQRRYARFVCNDYSRDRSVTVMLCTLDWDTLAERRGKSRATMTFRMRHCLVDLLIQDHLTHLNTRRRGNDDKFRVPYTALCKLDTPSSPTSHVFGTIFLMSPCPTVSSGQTPRMLQAAALWPPRPLQYGPPQASPSRAA